MVNIIVLMPYYNAFTDLKKSLESIDEEYKVDLLIVNDGSEKVLEIKNIKSFCTNSINNLYIENLKLNVGIERALNIGLEYIINDLSGNYKYIARLDAGDKFYKNKLTKQLRFLEENNDIKLLGTGADFIDLDGNKLYEVKHPFDHTNIKKSMYLYSPFIHPSVMISIELIKDGYRYPTNFKSAEDYAFFFEISQHYRVGNLNEILMAYEINPSGISISKRKEQKKSQLKIQFQYFNFTAISIIGLLRTLVLLYAPLNIVYFIKKLIRK